MVEGVSVLVPFRSSCPWRNRARDWLVPRLAAHYDVVVAGVVADDPDKGVWCKAEAVRTCLEASTGKILVIHDADVWISPDAMRQAIAAVAQGAAWAIPHRLVYRLSGDSTERVYRGEPIEGFTDPAVLAEFPYKGRTGGGCVVLRREVYQACPLDPAFRNWGAEDESWGFALETLFGAAMRFDGRLWHCWHPAEQRLNRHFGNPNSERRKRQYLRARGDRKAMESLINEIPPLISP